MTKLRTLGQLSHRSLAILHSVSGFVIVHGLHCSAGEYQLPNSKIRKKTRYKTKTENIFIHYI